MRIGDKSSNVKTMTISSYQPGDNDLSIDQWNYNCCCQSAIQEAKKGYLHAKQSVNYATAKNEWNTRSRTVFESSSPTNVNAREDIPNDDIILDEEINAT